MKKGFKIMFITSGILAVTGIGIALAGLCLGGSFQTVWGEMTQVAPLEGEIREIDVDLKAGELVIRHGNYETAEVSFDQSRTNVRTYMEGDVLYIESRGKWGHKGGNVELCLPKESILTEVSMDIGAGSVTADQLWADEISIHVGAGEFFCSGLVKTDALDCEVGLGSINIERADSKETDLECSMGELDITMEGSKWDYFMTGECTLGELTYGNRDWSFNDNIEGGNDMADRCIDAQCHLGDITIEFTEQED